MIKKDIVRESDIAKRKNTKLAAELVIAMKEKADRADKLIIANKELAFQNEEKEKRAEELFTANKEIKQLVQLNAEKHQGKIWAESKVGEEGKFKFTVPNK